MDLTDAFITLETAGQHLPEDFDKSCFYQAIGYLAGALRFRLGDHYIATIHGVNQVTTFERTDTGKNNVKE